MASPFTPGETAAVDQALAASDEDLDGLLRITRDLISRHGREKTMADITVVLKGLSKNHPSRIESLLLAAMLRLIRLQEMKTGQEQETGR
jgi:hypothetical protein